MVGASTHDEAKPHLRILGIRGLPANHGGFETFAEHLAPYLVEHGWKVTVYCQETGDGPVREDLWRGVHRVHIPCGADTPLRSMLFDWRSIVHAARSRDLCLTLGYNTAGFCAWLRLKGVPNLINMDGIEWKRAKWSRAARAWFWLNERLGCWLGDHLIADHPEIKKHLVTRVRPDKVSVIPYGAPLITEAPVEPVRLLGLQPGHYLTVIARAEPENSLLEIVQGFSARPRGVKLVVLGKYHADQPYHQAVKAAASAEVLFPGAIYDPHSIGALRRHGIAYLHGHQVGGTNPSLLEAMGAGNAVIARDNAFNRWVAGRCARYFRSAQEADGAITALLADPSATATQREAAAERVQADFTWSSVLGAYRMLLAQWAGRPSVLQSSDDFALAGSTATATATATATGWSTSTEARAAEAETARPQQALPTDHAPMR